MSVSKTRSLWTWATPDSGLFIDHYDFQRPHQGIDGLVPADHFFGAASEVSLPEPIYPQGIPTVNMDLVNEQPQSRAPRHWMKG